MIYITYDDGRIVEYPDNANVNITGKGVVSVTMTNNGRGGSSHTTLSIGSINVKGAKKKARRKWWPFGK